MVDDLTQPIWQTLQINGGKVEGSPPQRLVLPPTTSGYADAQFDDYAQCTSRSRFPWRPGVSMRLSARFSHSADDLQGTAGFGFWNAPFADPTVSGIALPQATWFFFASAPSNLPFAEKGPGRGWFAGTVDAAAPRALALIPLAPLALLANQAARFRNVLWPAIRRGLAISYATLNVPMTAWHEYELQWQPDGCRFYVDGHAVLETPYSPHGPLGFVCWIDNQYMVLTPRGRAAWGTLPTSATQWLELRDLEFVTASS